MNDEYVKVKIQNHLLYHLPVTDYSLQGIAYGLSVHNVMMANPNGCLYMH